MGKKVFSNVIHILLNNWTTSALISWRACDFTHQVGGAQQQLLLGEGEDYFHWPTCIWSLIANFVFYKKMGAALLVLYFEKKHSAAQQPFCFFSDALHEEKERAYWGWNRAAVCPSKREVCPFVLSFGEESLLCESKGVLRLWVLSDFLFTILYSIFDSDFFFFFVIASAFGRTSHWGTT